MGMKLESPAFRPGAAIPARHSCDGAGDSPPLAWSGAPAGTRSFVVLCDDPDAPGGTFSHWAVYDIPSATTALAQGVPGDVAVGKIRQGTNDFGGTGYGGPCPPRGHGTHRYRFRVLALNVDTLGLPPGAKFRAVAPAAEPHQLAQAELIGTYTRS